MLNRGSTSVFLLTSWAFIVSGCGGEQPATSTGAASGSGTGGGGGAGGGSASLRPECPDPGGPAGPTPLARADMGGALRADGRTMVVFGGDTAIVVCGSTPKREHVGDTWLLDTACGRWTELTLPVAPSARARHAMVLDEARDRALLFGGRTRPTGTMGDYTLFNDVWAFDFATQSWSEITTTGTAPSPRSNTAIAMAGDELVVFGGSTSVSGLTFEPQNDTYALNVTTGQWRSIAAANPPSARLFHSIAFDEVARTLFVVSGGDANAYTGPFLHDVLALDWDTATWYDVPTTGLSDDDLGRIKAGVVVRAPAAEPPSLLYFGGHDDGAFADLRNDVQSLALVGAPLPYPEPLAWSVLRQGDVYNNSAKGTCDFPVDLTIIDYESPERREGFALGQLPGGDAFVVFGGDSDCGRLNDAWWFDVPLGRWTPIRETLVGLVCPRTGNPNCTALCN